MLRPYISIVVATSNADRTLEHFISSVASQTFTDWELLIADGGSTDGTINIIKKYNNLISWWRSGKDAGIYDAWNRALEHASGEYICFLGADDAWSDPEALQSLVHIAREHRPDIVSAKGQLIDEDGRAVGETGREWSYQGLRRRIRICHPGALFARRLFDAFGAFDLRYRVVADYDWLLRLPESTSSRFLNRITVDVGYGGISRTQVWRRLRERREAHSRCPRIGRFWAYVYWADKIWRFPVARLLRLQH